MQPNANSNMMSNTPQTTPMNPGGDIVFKDKPKKNKGMIAGLIILALLAAGGIGFGVWAFLSGNQKEAKLNEQISDLQSQLANQPEVDETVIDVDTDKNTWQKLSNNLIQKRTTTEGWYWHYTGTENVHYLMSAIKDETGHLTITDNGDNNNSNPPVIIEVDNVLLVYYLRLGNGGVPYFYIIKTDGGVSRIDISENSNRQLEQVGDYNDIISVVESNLGALLVDTNGNVYETD